LGFCESLQGDLIRPLLLSSKQFGLMRDAFGVAPKLDDTQTESTTRYGE
jgi:hypothetical protein